MNKQQLAVVLTLGTTQTIGWASTYYLPAILATPIGAELGLSPTFTFGTLSAALVVSGLLGPRVGHIIDTLGGRGMLCISNAVFAVGLIGLSMASGAVSLIAAWLVIGVAMGMGLYEAAFAALTRLYGLQARQPIAGITMIAGFASTVGWPLTALIEARTGWRTTCLCWAAIHLVVALPLNLTLPRISTAQQKRAIAEAPVVIAHETRVMAAVAFVFAATAFVSSGLSATLPTMLSQMGATPAAAIFAASLMGPAQVVARIIEAGWLIRYHPITSTQIATLLPPLGVIALLAGGPVFASAFVICYGAGNGILTIARGTLPLALFGPRGFGRRLGILALPARVAGAASPLAIGLLLEHGPTVVLWVTVIALLSAFAALFTLSRAKPEPAPAGGD